MKLWITATFALLCLLPAGATDYYVSGSTNTSVSVSTNGTPGNGVYGFRLTARISLAYPKGGFVAPSVVTTTNSIAGSDSNPGTAVAPFLTMTKAFSVVTTGDTIHTYAGTYKEAVTNRMPSITLIAMERGSAFGIYISTNVTGTSLMGSNLFHWNGSNLALSSSQGTIKLGSGCHNTIIDGYSLQAMFSAGASESGAGSCMAVEDLGGNQMNLTNCIARNLVLTNTMGHGFALLGSRWTGSNWFGFDSNGWDFARLNTANSLFDMVRLSNWCKAASNDNHCDHVQAFTQNGAVVTNNFYTRWNATVDIFPGASPENPVVKIGNFSDPGNTNMHDNYFIGCVGIRIRELCDISGPKIHMLACTHYWGAQLGNPYSASVVNDATHGDGYGGRVYGSIFYCEGPNPGTNGFNGNGLGWSGPTNGQAGSVSGFSLGGFRSDFNHSVGVSNAAKRAYPSSVLGFRTPLYDPPFTNDLNGINGGDPYFLGGGAYSNTWLGPSITTAAGLTPDKTKSPDYHAGTNIILFLGGVTNQPGLREVLQTDLLGNPRPATGPWTIGAIEPP